VIQKCGSTKDNHSYGPGTLFQVGMFGGKNSLGCWAFLALLSPFDLIEEATKA
jgi:hypothetical protein